ncbi:MAG: FAD-dependent oxidoreductase [Herminiimonas sp.]|nr:FAD-dependent oxidoreductase [Herminiimonas sp.]
MNPILIIGAGMAGFTVARELRKLDKERPLVILTSDAGGFYSKPMLSNAFAQKKEAAQLLTQSAEQMAAQLGATILAATRVTGVDTVAKIVTTETDRIAYDQLVLAVGAQPIRLSIDGNGADQVLSVNNIADYAQFRELVAAPKHGASARVTILGAGLIGCEFADDLAGAGHAVTLIDPAALPLAALAAPALSRGLYAALTARGVALKLATTASRIDRSGDALHVTLADGSAFDTDIILSAVGLRPDLSIATAAGLATARGILVDASGQTSAADVYAVGDCAEYTIDAAGSTRILPYIAPLMTAARAIARTLTGTRTAIDIKDSPVIVKTPSYPIALVPPPQQALATGAWNDEQIDGRTICRFYDAGGLLAGFCVAPQDAAIRGSLLAALGSPAPAANPA